MSIAVPGYDNRVFAGSNRGCVDCGRPATRRLVYPQYLVGDLVCDDHRTIRTRQLGAGVLSTPVPKSVKVVTTEDDL